MKTIKFTFIILLVFFLNNNVFGQITGTKIINSAGGGDYISIDAAITDIQTNGIAGTVTFLIADGTYSEQILFENLNYSDSVLFKPLNQGGSVFISFMPNSVDFNYVIAFKNSKNIYLEGLNISNSNSISEIGTVIEFLGNTSNISIDNSIINGIFSNSVGESKSVIHHNETTSIYVCSNIKITNCTINNGTTGIFFKGYTTGEEQNMFAGNNILSFYTSGIESINQNSVTVAKNSIYANSGSPDATGILVSGSKLGIAQINSNKIELSAMNSSHGIQAFDNIAQVLVVNNMIKISYSNATLSTALNFDNNQILRIYHNSTLIEGVYEGVNLNIGSLNSTDVLILNNIFQNIQLAGKEKVKGGVGSYLINLSNPVTVLNHNIYFSDAVPIGYSVSSGWLTFNEWQTNTGYDNFSKFVDPMFNLVGYDLHIIGSSWAESHGIVTIPPTTNDFDGEPRFGQPGYEGFGTVPDIGADEGNFEGYIDGISGEIPNGTIWDKDVVVNGEIFINSGSTLTINPGVNVKFANNSIFNIYGTVIAEGTKLQNITFSGIQGSWTGINLIGIGVPISKFINCIFTDTYKPGNYGGAIYITSDTALIQSCTFINNSAYVGGAIAVQGGNPTIIDCYFENNYAEYMGGAMYIQTSYNPKIINNIFKNNNAYNEGGAVTFQNSPFIEFWNNTLVGNTSSYLTGNSISLNNSTVYLYNDIITNTINPDNSIYIADVTSSLNINYCDLPNGFATNNISNPNSGTFIENSNISADPVFNIEDGFEFKLAPISPCIDAGNPTSPYLAGVLDFLGNPRLSCNYNDIGAVEYDGCRLMPAYAGVDQIACTNTFTLTASDPAPYTGIWSLVEATGKIANINSPTTTLTNVAPGTNIYRWTVSAGTYTTSDEVIITNTKPYVNAGADLQFFSNTYGSDFPDANLSANDPVANYAYWEIISGNSVINSQTSYNANIGVKYGISVFKWYIEDQIEPTCNNTDTLIISAGYSFVSTPGDGTLDWGNPADWDVNGVPGPSDSVTIYNCIATISGPNAICRNLVIGNNSSLNLMGSAKGNVMLTANNLIIEENVVKFNGIKGTAVLEISDYATLNISDPGLTGTNTNPTFRVGFGGTVFIHSASAKDGKTIAGGNVNIGSGGKLFISQTAEKGSKLIGEALMEIGSGGKLFISQTAEKGIKLATGGNLNVGSGGKLFIHQTAEKGAAGGVVQIGSGGKLFISQTAEKGISGGVVQIGSGGKLFISQTAEKGVASGSIEIGSGGKLFISQTAEKFTQDSAFVYSPEIDIYGGSLFVGDAFGGPIYSILQCENLNIYGNVAKLIIPSDTNLYVFSNGLIEIQNDLSTQEVSKITLYDYATLTLEEGGKIDLSLVSNAPENFVIYPKGSFVDKNTTSILNAQAVYSLGNSGPNIFATYFSDAASDVFSYQYKLSNWNEEYNDWEQIFPRELLIPVKGYNIEGVNIPVSVNLPGKINTGDFSISLEANNADLDNKGWNFLGNPYPCSMTWDSITFDENTSSTYFYYNPILDNFEIYQKGGINLNGATGFIPSQGTFFVKVLNNDAILGTTNSVKTHNFGSSSIKSQLYQNLFTFRVDDGFLSNETAIRFTSLATEEFDTDLDAANRPDLNFSSPGLYTVSGISNDKFAINSLPLNSTETIIPLNFYSNNSVQFTFSLKSSSATEGVTVYLRDIYLNGPWIDLATNPNYLFDNISGQDAARFELKFSGEMVSVEDFVSNKEVKAYSNLKTIFIDNPKTSELSIQVIDINGKTLIMKSIYNSGVSEIQTNLPSGIYFVKAVSENKSSVHKIIIH
jgi:hypothetical protein